MLKEELESRLGVTVSVVPVVMGAIRAVRPKVGEWLQQIPEITFAISGQKGPILGTAKILHRTPRPEVEDQRARRRLKPAHSVRV